MPKLILISLDYNICSLSSFFYENYQHVIPVNIKKANFYSFFIFI